MFRSVSLLIQRFGFTIFQLLVKSVAWIFPTFSFLWLAEETKKNLPQELDFECEGKNAERVSELLQHIPFLKVSLTSDQDYSIRLHCGLLPGS